MSHIQTLTRQIRSLPYADMMVVANELSTRLLREQQKTVDATVLADILSRLQEAELAPAESTREEERVLREIFRIKRNLNIGRKGPGWAIEIPTVAGSNVVGTELRPLFTMMLDQIVTLHVLTK